jgi:hypothetical protein
MWQDGIEDTALRCLNPQQSNSVGILAKQSLTMHTMIQYDTKTEQLKLASTHSTTAGQDDNTGCVQQMQMQP